jgi:excisionase family DNA binding protein
MFLSLKEAAAKLNITEEQVQQLVRDGKLREFRDGANVLFKVDEVEGLVAEMPEAELEEVSLEAEPAEPEVEAGGDTALAAEVPVEEEEELKAEPAELEVEAGGDTALAPEAPVEKEEELEAKSAELEAEPEEVLEVSAAEGAAKAPEGKPEEALEEPDLLMEAEAGGETAGGKEGEGEEVALGLGESEDSGAGEELAEAETVAGTEGLNVLGETDIELEGAADTGAETKGGSGEASLEEIEEDVNLDSFGSGSGLLDLSLQADDTSLGGILDEIYTAEGEQDTTEGPALELGAEAEEAGEVEQEELAGPEPVLEAVPAAPRSWAATTGRAPVPGAGAAGEAEASRSPPTPRSRFRAPARSSPWAATAATPAARAPGTPRSTRAPAAAEPAARSSCSPARSA